MNTLSLNQFLIEANQAGYASGQEKEWQKEVDGSTSINFAKDNWEVHDNYFGGEPYGGRMIVFYKKQPVWMMIYYGWVVEGAEAEQVYKILRSALKQMPDEAPFRGPNELLEGDYAYRNIWSGGVERFSGEEQITEASKVIYQANYLGGLVDQKRGV